MRLRLLLLALVLGGCSPARWTPQNRTPAAAPASWPVSQQAVRLAERSDDLTAYASAGGAGVIPGELLRREPLLAERQRLRERRDRAGLARLNSILAAEAFERAGRVTRRWLDRRDPATGVFPSRLTPDGRFWTYGDAGADLFPFLALAAHLLAPERYPELLAVLAAERARSASFPQDFWLDSGQPLQHDDDPEDEAEKRMLGAVEYARDGLLPLVETLGPDPWLGRLREVIDQVIAAAETPTPYGPIPAASTEINGDALQALARLYWATRDPRYLEMGDRIAAAYLDRALPDTRFVPSHRWDFVQNQAIGPRRFFLGDHGNEVVAGLVEWHRVELASNSPLAAAHRLGLRRLLDRLQQFGRTPDGLWYELAEVPGGRVRDRDLTDNWGYLAQAYLDQAEIEQAAWQHDSQAHAERYRATALQALRAVSSIRYYAWQQGEMDGYADTLESALYLLRYLDLPAAEAWLDQQIGVLYGFQDPDGRVTDENIDGNFIRTTLLYGLFLTQGTQLEPWSDGLALGAAREGDCLRLHLHAAVPWSGRLRFDGQRHRAYLKLPTDYPRINQWPEWYAIGDGRSYLVTEGDGRRTLRHGPELLAGLPLRLEPGQPLELEVCPS